MAWMIALIVIAPVGAVVTWWLRDHYQQTQRRTSAAHAADGVHTLTPHTRRNCPFCPPGTQAHDGADRTDRLVSS